ncbi:MAG: leucine-rich repeat domain-containing protein, partial [Ruminococcus sp.]|nr:leucine-rich repeat domain-containing protein [Ruminococcus sp.]
MKKILSILTTVVFAVGIFASLPIAAESDYGTMVITPIETEIGDDKDVYEYRSWTSSGVRILSYIGTETDIVIPSELDGYSVVSIATDAFYGLTELKSVVIPDSVTEIDYYAFSGCPSLT